MERESGVSPANALIVVLAGCGDRGVALEIDDREAALVRGNSVGIGFYRMANDDDVGVG